MWYLPGVERSYIVQRTKQMRTRTRLLTNRKMSEDTYALRREVMTLVYEARKLVSLPRLDIRITENDRSVLAVARLRDNILWVTEKAITDSRFDLRTVVYHEIVHAVTGFGHDDNCPLMKPTHTPLTKEQCQSIFKKYFRA